MNALSLLLAAMLSATTAAAPSTTRQDDLRVRLAAQREVQLQRLHQYAISGVFPRNENDPSGPQEYFLDAKGRPCAVANLMILSGRRADVERIAATNNKVIVKNVFSGPIVDWIRDSGFTREEVEIIQKPAPGYPYSGGEDGPPIAQKDRRELRARLLGVEAQLRANNQTSLDLAVARY